MTNDAILARRDFANVAAALLQRGGHDMALHVRGPGSDGRTVWERSTALVATAQVSGARLVVNDRLDVALAAGAHGVHLGWRGVSTPHARRLVGKERLVGRSVHDRHQTMGAVADGSDYVVLGTIYPSPSHPSTAAAGVQAIRAVARDAGIPVIAIGGVMPERVAELVEAGAHGVAVVSGVWNEPRPVLALDRYIAALGGRT